MLQICVPDICYCSRSRCQTETTARSFSLLQNAGYVVRSCSLFIVFALRSVSASTISSWNPLKTFDQYNCEPFRFVLFRSVRGQQNINKILPNSERKTFEFRFFALAHAMQAHSTVGKRRWRREGEMHAIFANSRCTLDACKLCGGDAKRWNVLFRVEIRISTFSCRAANGEKYTLYHVPSICGTDMQMNG